MKHKQVVPQALAIRGSYLAKRIPHVRRSVRCMVLHLLYITFTLDYITFTFALHYITFHYITCRYITLHEIYITLHCIQRWLILGAIVIILNANESICFVCLWVCTPKSSISYFIVFVDVGAQRFWPRRIICLDLGQIRVPCAPAWVQLQKH